MKLFRSDRLLSGSKSGGVACYVNNRYIQHTREIPNFRVCNKDIECMGLVTEFPTHKHRTVVMCVSTT